jgi:hypothetical protein
MKLLSINIFIEVKFKNTITIQGDFEGCADILTCEKTPQKVD